MRLSEAWLRELVNPPVDTERLVEQLTMVGLEVDSVEPAAPPFSGVVIAQVVTVDNHPNADKLRVCQVTIDKGENRQIVCGADNVRAGMKVPLATLGAQLPGGLTIKKSKLRGVESFGMLCSAKELGLAESAEGLLELPGDAPVGEDLRRYLQLDDWLIDIDLTPNRADCLSVEGIAREISVCNRMPWQPVSVPYVPARHSQALSIEVEPAAQRACPRYLGRLIRGIDTAAATPIWMQERLRRSGLRSISAIVDVTNYVMLELGQPLHAFDAETIDGAIQVRLGHPGEKLILLDEQEIDLAEDVLVIADSSKPLALAGIMGGLQSAVSEATRDIFLECAFFAPDAIMGKARRYGLHTDSSHRFERGVDPELQQRAIERATQLIQQIAGGDAGPVTETIHPESLPDRPLITLRHSRIELLLGMSFSAEEVEDILPRLGMTLEPMEAAWRVTPPSFRFDVLIEADLIEELARIHGYDQLPSSSLNLPTKLQPAPEGKLPLDRIKDLMADRGYYEAITYSFVDQALQSQINPNVEAISLVNPISSELGSLRTTLWTGLLNAVRHNLHRQQSRLRLFESGMRFFREAGGIHQEMMLAGIVTGSVMPEQWGEPERPVDFFDLKGDVEAILALTNRNQDFYFVDDKHPALHPGQSAAIVDRQQQRKVGRIGMLHPLLADKLDLEQAIYLFELEKIIFETRCLPKFFPLSKFPQVRRDIALVISDNVTANDLLDCIHQSKSNILKDVVLFDVYRGKGLQSGEKSVALGLIFQHPEKTLTDQDIDQVIDKILQRLADEYGAKLRT